MTEKVGRLLYDPVIADFGNRLCSGGPAGGAGCCAAVIFFEGDAVL